MPYAYEIFNRKCRNQSKPSSPYHATVIKYTTTQYYIFKKRDVSGAVSMIWIFCRNSKCFFVVKDFCQKTPSQIFDGTKDLIPESKCSETDGVIVSTVEMLSVLTKLKKCFGETK